MSGPTVCQVTIHINSGIAETAEIETEYYFPNALESKVANIEFVGRFPGVETFPGVKTDEEGAYKIERAMSGNETIVINHALPTKALDQRSVLQYCSPKCYVGLCRPDGFSDLTFQAVEWPHVPRIRIKLVADKLEYPMLLSNGVLEESHTMEVLHSKTFLQERDKPNDRISFIIGDMVTDLCPHVTPERNRIDILSSIIQEPEGSRRDRLAHERNNEIKTSQLEYAGFASLQTVQFFENEAWGKFAYLCPRYEIVGIDTMPPVAAVYSPSLCFVRSENMLGDYVRSTDEDFRRVARCQSYVGSMIYLDNKVPGLRLQQIRVLAHAFATHWMHYMFDPVMERVRASQISFNEIPFRQVLLQTRLDWWERKDKFLPVRAPIPKFRKKKQETSTSAAEPNPPWEPAALEDGLSGELILGEEEGGFKKEAVVEGNLNGDAFRSHCFGDICFNDQFAALENARPMHLAVRLGCDENNKMILQWGYARSVQVANPNELICTLKYKWFSRESKRVTTPKLIQLSGLAGSVQLTCEDQDDLLLMESGCWAPVMISQVRTVEDLGAIVKDCPDPYHRWIAMMDLYCLWAADILEHKTESTFASQSIVQDIIKFAVHDMTEPGLSSELLTLPPVLTAMAMSPNLSGQSPVLIHEAFANIYRSIGDQYASRLERLIEGWSDKGRDVMVNAEAQWRRAKKNALLNLLSFSLEKGNRTIKTVYRNHYDRAYNYNDRKKVVDFMVARGSDEGDTYLDELWYYCKAFDRVSYATLIESATKTCKGPQWIIDFYKEAKANKFVNSPVIRRAFFNGYADNATLFHGPDGYRLYAMEILEAEACGDVVTACEALSRFNCYPLLPRENQCLMLKTLEELSLSRSHPKNVLEILTKNLRAVVN